MDVLIFGPSSSSGMVFEDVDKNVHILLFYLLDKMDSLFEDDDQDDKVVVRTEVSLISWGGEEAR